MVLDSAEGRELPPKPGATATIVSRRCSAAYTTNERGTQPDGLLGPHRSSHPDRNTQFEHLNGQVKLQLMAGEPVVSVDTKKKELIWPFKNGGRELRPKGEPEKVRVHDFIDRELGRVNP